MPNLLLVCTANVCRSPIAEGLARQHLAAAGHRDWSVESAAAWGPSGSLASESSLRVLGERGIDLSAHRSRALTLEMMVEADLVLVMAQSHKTYIREKFPEQAHMLHLLSEMAGSARDIADPMGQPIERYRQALAEIDDLLRRGLDRITGFGRKRDREQC